MSNNKHNDQPSSISEGTEATQGPRGQLAMQTIAVERDANPGGSMFGGWVLAQMDMAGAALAYGLAQQRIVTVSADKIRFHRPLIIGQDVQLYTDLVKTGRSSIAVDVNVWHISENKEFFNVAEGIFTFVALDFQGKPDKTLCQRIAPAAVSGALDSGTLDN